MADDTGIRQRDDKWQVRVSYEDMAGKRHTLTATVATKSEARRKRDEFRAIRDSGQNIGTGKETDILTVYLKLQELLGSPLGPVHAPAKPGEQRRSVLDSTLAQSELGWQPRVSLAEGLAQTATAFREAEAR